MPNFQDQIRVLDSSNSDDEDFSGGKNGQSPEVTEISSSKSFVRKPILLSNRMMLVDADFSIEEAARDFIFNLPSFQGSMSMKRIQNWGVIVGSSEIPIKEHVEIILRVLLHLLAKNFTLSNDSMLDLVNLALN